jgi:hypothetical protein
LKRYAWFSCRAFDRRRSTLSVFHRYHSRFIRLV